HALLHNGKPHFFTRFQRGVDDTLEALKGHPAEHALARCHHPGNRCDASLQLRKGEIGRMNEDSLTPRYARHGKLVAMLEMLPPDEPVAPLGNATNHPPVVAPGKLNGLANRFPVMLEHTVGAVRMIRPDESQLRHQMVRLITDIGLYAPLLSG